MNSAALYFASGESLYPGAALLVLAIAGSTFSSKKWHFQLRNITAWLALALVIMACPPFPWIIDLIFLVAFGSWLIAWNTHAELKTFRTATASVLVSLMTVCSVSEWQHRSMPALSGLGTDHLVIIGDSISSGINSQITAWPTIMQQSTNVPVVNLARPAATAADGMVMADKLRPEDRLVLIELGGNDLITGLPSTDFGNCLEMILRKIAVHDRTVVMFELPLLPQRIAYGQIQRRLAKKYGVWLIPKRFFVRVISGPDATSDGLHLTAIGAQRMAGLVAQALLPVLKAARPQVGVRSQLFFTIL